MIVNGALQSSTASFDILHVTSTAALALLLLGSAFIFIRLDRASRR